MSGRSIGDHANRAAALANYALMFFATFTLGILALLAVILAYARRGRVDALTRSHYDYQIRCFWQDLALIVAGFLCGWGAVASGIGALLKVYGVTLPWGVTTGEAGWVAIGLALAWMILWIVGFFNLIVESAVGFLKLASGRPAGKKLLP